MDAQTTAALQQIQATLDSIARGLAAIGSRFDELDDRIGNIEADISTIVATFEQGDPPP
jgi:hypothetical protein